MNISSIPVYDDAGNRVQETVSGTTTFYLTDTNNPTGYAQPIEAKTNPAAGARPTMTYIIGDRILAQAVGLTQPAWIIADAHGDTRQITVLGGGLIAATFNYDAFGTGTNFSVGSTGTIDLFGGDAVFDPTSKLYLHGDGTRPSQGFRFIQADSQGYNNPSNPVTNNLYLLDNADAINYHDYNGHDGELVGTMGTLSLGMGLMAAITVIVSAVAIQHSAVLTSAVAGAVNTAEDWLSSGVGELEMAASKLLNNAQKVGQAIQNAIDEAVAAGQATLQELSNIPIFPVIKSFGPAIYKFDVAALASNPAWYMLNYLGPNNPETELNRQEIDKLRGRIMANALPGDQMDEFPYASTEQGGLGAWVTGVPALQNQVQGGLLQAFYRYSLKGKPDSPFLVAPLNI